MSDQDRSTRKVAVTEEIFAKWPKERQDAWIARKQGYIASIRADREAMRHEISSLNAQISRYNHAAWIERTIRQYAMGVEEVQKELRDVWTLKMGALHTDKTWKTAKKLIDAFDVIDREAAQDKKDKDWVNAVAAAYKNNSPAARLSMRNGWQMAERSTRGRPERLKSWTEATEMLDSFSKIEADEVSATRVAGEMELRCPVREIHEDRQCVLSRGHAGGHRLSVPKFASGGFIPGPCNAILNPELTGRSWPQSQLMTCLLPKGHPDELHVHHNQGWVEAHTVGYLR